MSNSVKFKEINDNNTKLIIDCVYEHGKPWSLSKDALSKLMKVKNVGGFRTKSGLKYVVLYSTNSDIYWRDVLDTELGLYIYYGDNKKPGVDLHGPYGNRVLKDVFEYAESSDLNVRKKIPPFFLFESDRENGGVKFRGLLVPGYRGINHLDWLTAVWAQLNEGGRFQNYKSMFTVLDTSSGSTASPKDATIDIRWLKDLEEGHGYDSIYAPLSWKNYIEKGIFKPLAISVTSAIRTKEQQLPEEGLKKEMLNYIYNYFIDNPTYFESFALGITVLADDNIFDEQQTRPTRDGGRDGIGKYAIMKKLKTSLNTTFAVEAKCYEPNRSVGVKETSRLISRIRHRQFGVFVTTSFVAQQAYEEILEDEQPIAIIAGSDIIEILFQNQITSLAKLIVYLNNNYPKEMI